MTQGNWNQGTDTFGERVAQRFSQVAPQSQIAPHAAHAEIRGSKAAARGVVAAQTDPHHADTRGIDVVACLNMVDD